MSVPKETYTNLSAIDTKFSDFVEGEHFGYYNVTLSTYELILKVDGGASGNAWSVKRKEWMTLDDNALVLKLKEINFSYRVYNP